jgi:poly-gamma-glutamate capsule biosynthesis protein CapA/YwtB (metallophosphatase superfamily)
MYASNVKTLRQNIPVWAFFILLTLSGCQGNAGLGTNLFASDSGFREATVPFTPEPAVQKPFVYEEASPRVIGGVVSAVPEDASALFEKMSGRDKYKLIVVMAYTSHLQEGARVLTYSGSGVLKGMGIEVDAGVVKKLVDSGMVRDLGEVGPGSSWNKPVTAVFRKYFPAARFVFVSLNQDISPEELNSAAYILNTAVPADSLVLGIADYIAPENAKISQFEKGFTSTVLKSFDVEKFDELPVSSAAAVKAVALYLRYAGAGKLEDFIGSGFAQQALYAMGKPETGVNSNGGTESGGTGNDRPLYLVAFGDVMLGRFVRTLMDKNGHDYPFEKMDTQYMRVNDILLANLEGPIAEKAVKTSKAIAFRFPPDTVEILEKYYFDALSLANNHIFDMGTAGYDDTVKLLNEAGIANFGDPRDSGSASSTVLLARGQKIAFLGLEDVVYKIDEDKAVKEIKRLVAKGDTVIPVVHWGVEYTHKPNARQKDLAHKFIDAGAAAVIGHHPHVVQAYETYKGRPIFYSLGNAVFDQYWSADTQVGLSVSMIMDGGSTEMFIIPHKIVTSQIQLMDEKEAAKFLEEFSGYGEGDATEKEALANGHLILPQ